MRRELRGELCGAFGGRRSPDDPRSRAGQTRPCRLETAALDTAVGWIEANTRAWTERFDKLDAHLRTLGQR